MPNEKITDAMLTRTPKAVRDRLAQLERQNASLFDELQVAHGQAPPGCNTWVRESLHWNRPDRPIGRGARILFDTKEGLLDCRVREDGYLSVRSEWAVLVAPESSNSIRVLSGKIR